MLSDQNEEAIRYYRKGGFRCDTIELSEETIDVDLNQPEKIVKAMCNVYNKDDEFEAGKILYNHLKRLSPRDASNTKLWTKLNHSTFYEYIVKRWGDLWDTDKQPANQGAFIINHWIQSNSTQGDLIDYPISGLWWSFYISEDSTRQDPYELTRILFKNQSFRTKYLGQARFARHKPAVIAVLEFIQENKLDEGNQLESVARGIVPFVNLLGGIRPLSYFDKDWFKRNLEERFSGQIREGVPLFTRPTKNGEQTGNNQASTSLDLEETKTQSVPPKQNAIWLNIKYNGHYQINSTENTSKDCFAVKLNKEDKLHHLAICYDNGKVNRVTIESLYQKKMNKQYKNGLNPKAKVVHIGILKNDYNLGVLMQYGEEKFFKAFPVSLLKEDNGTLGLEGYTSTKFDDFDGVKYSFIHPNIDLGTLLHDGRRGEGGELSNNYYQAIWNNLIKHEPSWFTGSLNL